MGHVCVLCSEVIYVHKILNMVIGVLYREVISLPLPLLLPSPPSSQLTCLTPNQEKSKKEVTRIVSERDSLRGKLNELRQEKQALQQQVKSQGPADQRVLELQGQVRARD